MTGDQLVSFSTGFLVAILIVIMIINFLWSIMREVWEYILFEFKDVPSFTSRLAGCFNNADEYKERVKRWYEEMDKEKEKSDAE